MNWQPVGNSDVSASSYGRERVTHRKVGQTDRGFARLRITNDDWNYESVTPIQGWIDSSLREGFQTRGISLNRPDVIRSTVDSWTEDGLSLAAASVTGNVDPTPSLP